MRPLAIVRIPLAYVTGPPPSTRPVIKRGLAASSDVPVIAAAPTRDEHDFDASHCPVSLDRPHEQDREVQATTPLPRRGRAERPRATADDDGSLRGRKGTTHRRPCPDSARASLPARDQLRHPPGAASRARFHA